MEAANPHRQHTFQPFDIDMGRLRSAVLRMTALVERQLCRAVKAAALNAASDAAQVVSEEPALQDLHAEIDALVALVIARHQPVASDLRELLASIQVIDDLERIGHEARRIARRVGPAETLTRLPGSDEAETLLAEIARALRELADAFVNRDAQAATALRARVETLEAKSSDAIDAQQARLTATSPDLQSAWSSNFILQALGRATSHLRQASLCVERSFESSPAAA